MKIRKLCWSEQFLLSPNMSCSIYKAESKLEVLEQMRCSNAQTKNKTVI